MKKILSILCSFLLLFTLSTVVKADEGHIILGTDEEGIVDPYTEQDLEEDLDHVAQDYDIDVYFVYDSDISDENIETYAQNFITTNGSCTNNVVMVLNEDWWVIKASGPEAYLIENNSSEIFNRFAEADAFSDNIRGYYQYVIKLINSEAYSSGVDRVYGTPSVVDLADLLSDGEERVVAAKLDKLYSQYGIKVVAVTTDDLHGMSEMDYADDFYDYNGYPEDGVLFLLSMENRKWWFSTKGNGIDYFTDYGIDYVAEEMMPYLKSGEYYDALETYANCAGYLIEEGEKGDPVDTHNRPAEFGMMNVGIGLSAGLIASLVTVLVMKGKLKSVRKQRFAGNYIIQDSFLLTGFADMFVNKSVSRSARPKDNDSHGGGSSIHTSSSGSSHGGHGGSF